MTREDQFLLELLKGSLWGSTIELDPKEVDWETLLDTAALQTVTLSAFDGAAQIKNQIPKEIYVRWQQVAFRKLQSNMQVTAAQEELITILEQSAFPYVILKGSAAAFYYPNSELRQLGDVDFLINPEQKQAIAMKLMEAGYTRSHEDHICHQVFKKERAHLEMHHEPAGIPNGTAGEILRGVLAETLNHRQVQNGFSAPAPFYHGLILLLHMQHHMVSEGLGLRHLCDWACFVYKTHRDAFWQERMIPLLKEIGLLRYMNVMTAVCVSTLGIEGPDWMEPVSKTLKDAILGDILQGGNFGRKDPKRSASKIMISNHGKDGVGRSKAYYLYDTLHQSTLEQYPFAKKSKLFGFLIDCGRALRYLVGAATGNRYSLRSLAKDADSRTDIYRQLEIFETRKD